MADDSDEQFDAAIAQRQIPPVLFRYRAFNDHTEDSISNGVQMFSSPFSFNDPFDCQINDNGKYGHADLVAFLEKNGHGHDESEKAAERHFKLDPAKRVEFFRKMSGTAHSRLGLLCFSERPDSILMWSHYADSHKGYVLGFTIKNDRAFFTSPLKVKYASEYPDVSFLRDTGETLKICLKTKSKEWEYEKEIRVLKSPKLNAPTVPASGMRAYKKECLTEVILGCWVSNKDRARMEKLLADPDYSHVTLKQATISPTSFAVDISTTA